MGVTRRLASIVLPLAVAALALTLPADGGAKAPLEPLVLGWEQIFKLDWELEERRGRLVLRGYLVNDSPYSIARVRLLVDGLDDSGGIVAQRISWFLGDLMPFSRGFFEAPVPGRHPKYQVRVFAYDRVESNGRQREP